MEKFAEIVLCGFWDPFGPSPRVTNKTTENMSKADSGDKMVLGGLEPADTYRKQGTPNFFLQNVDLNLKLNKLRLKLCQAQV